MPVAIPTWRKVLLAPEAMPLRSGGTTEMADEARTGLTVPIPMPATMKPGQQHGPGRRGIGGGHDQAAGRDQQQAGPEQVPRLDPHGQLAGDGGHDEGQHGEGQEPHTGRQGPVAQVVLDVEGQVEEQREDRRRQGECGERHSDHGRTPEQGEVQHRVVLAPLGDQEDHQQHDRTDQQADDQRAAPAVVVARG